MSEDVLNLGNSIPISQEQGEKLLSPSRVNDIVADRLARQEEKLRRQFEEDLNKVRSSLPDEGAIAARVRSELETQYKKDLEQQQNAAMQMQFEKDKNQYQNQVKDIKISPEEDRMGLFDSKNDQKYLALKIAAGNFNMEGTAEIMKELARNPRKLRDLNEAAKDGDWDYVKESFKDISSSMKENEYSRKTYSRASEPLSHLKSSSGGSSSREMTQEDYRNDPSLYF